MNAGSEAETSSWNCPSCRSDNDAAAGYCPQCGERRLRPHDLSLLALLEQAFESVAHYDGRIFRSVRTLLARPGALTAEYMAGARRPWVGPFQLFLVANLLFFLMQVVSGLNVLSVPLRVHLDGQFYSGWARQLIDARINAGTVDLATYTAAFEAHQSGLAKALVVVMVPLFALAVWPWSARRPAVAHVVYALHFYAYMLVLLAILFPVAALGLGLLHRLGGVVMSPHSIDRVISFIELLAIWGYQWQACRRAYGLRWPLALAFATVLAVIVPLLLYGYRGFVFWITAVTT